MDVVSSRITEGNVESRVPIAESVAAASAGDTHAVEQGHQDAAVAQVAVEVAVVAARDVELDADIREVRVGDADGAGVGPAGGIAVGNDAAIGKAAGEGIAVNPGVGSRREIGRASCRE